MQGLMRTRTGELTPRSPASSTAVLESLPDKHKGFSDGQQRQRMRYRISSTRTPARFPA